MSIVNCNKHGKIIGINVCRHIVSEIKNGKKNKNIASIKYEFFPDDKEHPYVENFYCNLCAEKYSLPEGLIITAEMMAGEIEPNMYENAQEELSIICPKCFSESLE